MFPTRTQAAAIAAVSAGVMTSLCVLLLIRKRRTRPNRSHRVAQHKRQGLLHPLHEQNETPWQRLLQTGSEGNFIVVTKFRRNIFLTTLFPIFETSRLTCTNGSPYPRSTSKPRLPSSLSFWLDYSLYVLLRGVRKKDSVSFEVCWPTVSEMKTSAALLQKNRHSGPFFRGLFGIKNGERFRCQNYGKIELQNAYYESYTQQEEFTNLFVFNFFGEITHAAVNYPGSWHDTNLAGVSGLYYLKLSDAVTSPGLAILGDSAFVSNPSCTNGKILRARESNETSSIPESAELAAIDLVMQRVLPSERKSAEWGIRAIKGPFQRLKSVLPTDFGKRGVLIELAICLLNGRTRLMGRNHIASKYNPTSPRL